MNRAGQKKPAIAYSRGEFPEVIACDGLNKQLPFAYPVISINLIFSMEQLSKKHIQNTRHSSQKWFIKSHP